MDERKNNYNDPWDQEIYGTGSTRPPKNHGSAIAVIMVVSIFICGIIGALSLLKIRLFNLESNPDDPSSPISFHGTAATQDPTENTPSQPTVTAPGGDHQVSLETSPTSDENVPQPGGLSLQKIYEMNIPSVVSIVCTGSGGSSSGTGVVLSQDGYIVTNCHVVEDAAQIRVILSDDRTLSASLVGADAVSDLAVLYVQAEDLTAAHFGDSNALRVGDVVVAIGDPLGTELRGTMTDGIVSAINRDITTGGRTMTLIQTNAALNAGNSGGPLINCYGQVIGINTMKIGDYMSTAGVEGLGFAIPSTTVKEIVDQLVKQGYVSGRPTLGITGESISDFHQMYYRWPAGLYITAVDEDSDAASQNIAAGDILISINGTRVTDMQTLQQLLYGCQVGDQVTAVIYRGGRQYSLTLTLSEANG